MTVKTCPWEPRPIQAGIPPRTGVLSGKNLNNGFRESKALSVIMVTAGALVNPLFPYQDSYMLRVPHTGASNGLEGEGRAGMSSGPIR